MGQRGMELAKNGDRMDRKGVRRGRFGVTEDLKSAKGVTTETREKSAVGRCEAAASPGGAKNVGGDLGKKAMKPHENCGKDVAKDEKTLR